MKLSKTYLILLFVLVSNSLLAQVKLHKKVYKQAMRYADATTAATALNSLIAEGETTYKDTLALLYTTTRMHTPAYILTKELLETKPQSKFLLEMQAQNAEELGMHQEALTHLNTLLRLDAKNSFYYYKKGLLLVTIKEYSNCLQTINQALGLPRDPSAQITVESSKGGTVVIPLRAEFFNLKGKVYYLLKDVIAAEDAFNRALALAPDYKTAASNLATLKNTN